MISRHQFVTAVIGTASLLCLQGIGSFLPPSSSWLRISTPLFTGSTPAIAKSPQSTPSGQEEISNHGPVDNPFSW